MTTPSRPRRRTLIAAGGAVVLAGAGLGVATALDAGSPPPPRPLGAAVAGALGAPAPTGITADVELVNRLVDPTILAALGAGDALGGGRGRIWVADGGFRLEVQGAAGDLQVLGRGDEITLVDAARGDGLRLRLPASIPALLERGPGPTPASVAAWLRRARGDADVSAPEPRVVAGRPAYEVRVAPRGDSGLVAGVRVAFDAENGTPLLVALDADAAEAPVLELRMSSVAYGPVPAANLTVPVPGDARVLDLGASGARARARGAAAARDAVVGLAAVRRAAPFTVRAPATLVGLPRRDVRLVGRGRDRAVLVTYGRGLGAIVVSQRPAGSGAVLPAGLPAIALDGATGRELATALGTAIGFRRAGVEHLVVGSVPAQAAEAAAREIR